MQFVVPQFIDLEPKILGPITARQFVIMIFTFGAIFLCYKYGPANLWLLEAIIILIIGATFAFVKINGRPFHYFLLNFIQTLKRPKLLVWSKENLSIVEKEFKEKPNKGQKIVIRKPLSSTNLSDIALLVDTGGKYKK